MDVCPPRQAVSPRSPASGLRGPGRRALIGRRALARGGDLLLDGVAPGELALGLLVPAARVVEVALEHVHDAVQPRGQRRGLLLDDLVGGLPVTGFQPVEHAGGVHGASIMPPRLAGSLMLHPYRRRLPWRNSRW